MSLNACFKLVKYSPDVIRTIVYKTETRTNSKSQTCNCSILSLWPCVKLQPVRLSDSRLVFAFSFITLCDLLKGHIWIHANLVCCKFSINNFTDYHTFPGIQLINWTQELLFWKMQNAMFKKHSENISSKKLRNDIVKIFTILIVYAKIFKLTTILF